MSEEAALPPPKIGVRLALTGDPGELLADARALENAGAHSIWVDASDGDPYVMLAAIAAVTWQVTLVAAGDPGGKGRSTCERLSRGRLIIAEEMRDRWVHVAFPADRNAWRETRASASASGAAGVVIRNDPRLLDLLRNPDREDDRADVNIAVG